MIMIIIIMIFIIIMSISCSGYSAWFTVLGSGLKQVATGSQVSLFLLLMGTVLSLESLLSPAMLFSG